MRSAALPEPAPSTSGNPGSEFFDKLGWDAPGWLVAVMTVLLVAAAVIAVIDPVQKFLRPLLTPLTARRGRRRDQLPAIHRRQLFADHLESQLRRVSEKNEWRDRRFAELEANVEIEGQERSLLRPWTTVRRTGPRRVRSLSKGLRRSAERLVLLQGEPGSGKSVALRHLALVLAREAMHSERLDSLLPVYVNLKGFEPPERPVTRVHLRDYVLASLNRVDSRQIEEFLDTDFDQGMRDGRWLFLFDSFDEIPHILSATESGGVVEEYADAIFDFLHTINRSRGIVASREFKGPRGFGWPRFTVLRLSPPQQLDLIRRADLTAEQQQQVIGGLAEADGTVADLAGNPMMLGLLCEYVRSHGAFPQGNHALFDDYVDTRLEHDADRVRRRFQLEPAQLRLVAEQVAFCMGEDASISLTPTRTALAQAVAGTFAAVPELDRALDALEFVNLGSEPELAGDRSRFTFAHRRFQEFFATCVVLREPDRVPVPVLLLDGRWRETAVTMLQTGSGPHVDELLSEAERILQLAARPDDEPGARPALAAPYPWPTHCLHILDLLRAGIVDAGERLPGSFREDVAGLLLDAYDNGRRLDRKWSTEASVLAPPDVRDDIIGRAAGSGSSLLQQSAFAQAGRLKSLPPDLRRHIQRLLVGMSATGQLHREKVSIRAQLSRLSEPAPFLRGMTMMLVAPAVEALLFLAVLGTAAVTGVDAVMRGSSFPTGPIVAALAALVLPASFQVLRCLAFFASVARGSRTVNLLERLFSGKAADRYESRQIVLLTLAARFVAVLVIDLSLSPQGSLLLLVSWLYLTLWPVAAIIWVARRGGPRYATWPLLPVVAIAAAFRGRLRPARPRVTLNGVAMVVAVPLLFLAASWSARLVPRTVLYGVGAVFAVATVVQMVRVLGSLFSSARRALVSRLAIRREALFVRSLTADEALDAERLIDTLIQLHTDAGLYDLVYRIRRGELSITPDAMIFLEDLAAALEADLDPAEALDRPGMRGFLIESVSDRTLDEVALIAEERRLPRVA